MVVDYNLVVIGASEAGLYAAIAARTMKARVALVDQGCFQAPTESSYQLQRIFLHQLGCSLKTLSTLEKFGLNLPRVLLRETEPLSIDWKVPDRWLAESLQNWQTICSPAVLSSLGIDVVSGKGQFHNQPSLAFRVGNRDLKGQAYLLAISGQPRLPDLNGLQMIPYYALDRLEQLLQQPTLPKSILLMGGESQAVEGAQILRRLGCQVTLVVAGLSLLRQEDPEISQLIQAHLEAEGVKVLLGTTIDQIKVIQGQTWVQAGSQAIVADAICLETTYGLDPSMLNLEAASVRWGEQGIRRNRRLQTSNPKVYCCDAGPDPSVNRALHEVNIILKNALFAPLYRANYSALPHLSLTDPSLARLGMTEVQARKKYGEAVVVLKSSAQDHPTGQISREEGEFCKLIIHQSGKILGAHILSSHALELSGTIALAMQQHLSITALAASLHPIPGHNQLLYNTMQQWQAHHLSRSPRLTSLLESWHNLRRSWLVWMP